MKMKKIKKIFLVLFLLLLFSWFAIAELSAKSLKAEADLQSAEKAKEEMQKEGFSVTRYQDTLTLTKQNYEAQLALEKNKGKPDYSVFYGKIADLEKIKQQAFLAVDELKALELTINQTKGINLTSVLELHRAAKKDFNAERYENCLKLIGEAYTKISELEAVQTKIKAFYEATSRGLVNFLKTQWKWISISLFVFVLVAFLSYNQITGYRLKRKIENLEQRREVIKKLIAQTQKEYLERGTISGSKYEIRIRKYSELIRDINRQIPLLRTELEMKKKVKIKEEIVSREKKVKIKKGEGVPKRRT